jgi:mycoredoxin-dependent peroxiredoxin
VSLVFSSVYVLIPIGVKSYARLTGLSSLGLGAFSAVFAGELRQFDAMRESMLSLDRGEFHAAMICSPCRRWRGRNAPVIMEVHYSPMSAPQSLSASATLNVGDMAPDFTLPDTRNNKVSLSDFRGKQNVVLAFFPYAFSGTCSAQMKSCESDIGRFQSLDTAVLGISMDARYSLAAWADQLGLTFTMLSDFYPQGVVVDAYGVRHPAGMAERAVFVIDKNGVIRWIHVHRPISEAPNNEEILAVLSAL